MKPTEVITKLNVHPSIGAITNDDNSCTCLLGFCAYAQGMFNPSRLATVYSNSPVVDGMAEFIRFHYPTFKPQYESNYQLVYMFNDMFLPKLAENKLRSVFGEAFTGFELRDFREWQPTFESTVMEFLTEFEASEFYKNWERNLFAPKLET